MNSFYDFDYCCKELEKIGREIRNKILESMPVAITDLGLIDMFLFLHIWECPFCHKSIAKTHEKMWDQKCRRSIKSMDNEKQERQ